MVSLQEIVWGRVFETPRGDKSSVRIVEHKWRYRPSVVLPHILGEKTHSMAVYSMKEVVTVLDDSWVLG